MENQQGRYLKLSDATKVIGADRRTLLKMISRGELPPTIRIAGRHHFQREKFFEALEKLEKQTAGAA